MKIDITQVGYNLGEIVLWLERKRGRLINMRRPFAIWRYPVTTIRDGWVIKEQQINFGKG
jgi:hypothetical protein